MRWLHGFDLSPGLLAMWLCVALGAMILTQFTRLGGMLGFVVNATVLLAGATAANLLVSAIPVPLSPTVDKTLLVSFAGMLACSLGLLMLFPRHRGG